jgi:hypothetical protein
MSEPMNPGAFLRISDHAVTSRDSIPGGRSCLGRSIPNRDM